jgi:hypothetical protein
MSKRLQVVLPDADLERYKRTARAAGLSLSEWVRRALSSGERQVSVGDIEPKLAAVREALKHSYPAPDIEHMLSEIQGGYRPAGSL